jgi:ribulose-5-phosphate 4-epimerase/fuculose-1-phosphate aldolase
MIEDELREQVAAGCRILAATGHDDFVWGHVSARDPQDRGIWMKAASFAFGRSPPSTSSLLPVSHAGTLFVPPDVPHYAKTAELIVTCSMGADVADALGPLYALFLVNHGIVTADKDVRDAVIRAVLLEKAARHQLLTYAFGGPRRWSSDEEALRKRATAWSEQ